MARFFISRRWQWPKFIIFLFVMELPFTVAALALFGIAAPDLYRTRMWQIGANYGFNSPPDEILFSYANYRPMSTPIVWSQFITNYNVVISVLSMFILLCKSVMFIVHVWFPILSFVVHLALVALFAVSTYIQQAPDYSDATAPSNHPWYLSGHSCNLAVDKTDIGYCRQAVSAFAVTVSLLAIFAFHTCVSLYSMVPTRDQRIAHATEILEKKQAAEDEEINERHQWELSQIKTPAQGAFPQTPRTRAFAALAGAPPTPGFPRKEYYGGGYTPEMSGAQTLQPASNAVDEDDAKTPTVEEARSVSISSFSRPSQIGVATDLPLRER